MRKLIAAVVYGASVVCGTLALAQGGPGPGHHVVMLPGSSVGAARSESTVLLETPHLKLVTITVPKGGTLTAHVAQEQVSIQALHGSGEVKLAGASARIDRTHALVLAPRMEHEVRAAGDSDLVLLVHHVAPGGRGMGSAVGPGMGRGMGRGPRSGDVGSR